MTALIRRREFITLLGGTTATWPLVARAQQPTMPVIGLLDQRSPDELADRLRGFRQGLRDSGFVEGQNVAIDYRWAEGQYDRLPALAADLVRRQVAVILAEGNTPALAAKAATSTIPIVFIGGNDPVRTGLVERINRPGGNLTGVELFVGLLGAKRLGLLHELIPNAAVIALLVNPDNVNVARLRNDVEEAGRTIGRQIVVANARSGRLLFEHGDSILATMFFTILHKEFLLFCF